MDDGRTALESAILERRAERLAETVAADAPGDRVVTFLLANERYAVSERYVRGVSRLRTLSLVPGAPAYVAGITYEHGVVYSVVDLAAWFGLPARGLTESDPLVIVADGGMEVALLADAIIGGRLAPIATGRPSSENGAGDGRMPYVAGIAAGLIVLDIPRILGDPKFIV